MSDARKRLDAVARKLAARRDPADELDAPAVAFLKLQATRAREESAGLYDADGRRVEPGQVPAGASEGESCPAK